MMKVNRNILFVLIACFALAPLGRVNAADSVSEVDLLQNLYAQRWMEAFRSLDARNNITMILSNRDSFYELNNVVEIEACTRFLVVRCKNDDGIYYRALVYPTTIMLIKETPRTQAAKQPKQ